MVKIKTKPCDGCGGTGAVPADNTGEVLMQSRMDKAITRVALAEVMGVSPTYIRDLELGGAFKPVSNEMAERYQKAVEQLTT